jgi:predicted lipoprotein
MVKKFLSLVFLAMFMYSCSSNEGEDESIIFVDDFDRGLMLTNLADNIIIPSYEGFASKMILLNNAGQDFTATPNQNTLDLFRSSWLNAYKSWQGIEMFNIGKAEELQYSFYMNVYPLTVSDVQNNVMNGGYNLNNVNNQDAQGFPALDYLLHGISDNDADLLAIFTSGPNASGYSNYVNDVLNQMNNLTQEVLNNWKDSFRSTFINSKSNTATSSLNKLVNDFIFYYEKGLRANKFGIPAGVFSANPLPEKVEAFYKKDISKELALDALQAVEDFFNGKQYNGTSTGESFKSYLLYLERDDIYISTRDQFNIARLEINNLTNNLSEQVITDNSKMTRAYDELQKAVVLIKVDMLQAFSVNIDYVDADGD